MAFSFVVELGNTHRPMVKPKLWASSPRQNLRFGTICSVQRNR
jgi:hypothetical protein